MDYFCWFNWCVGIFIFIPHIHIPFHLFFPTPLSTPPQPKNHLPHPPHFLYKSERESYKEPKALEVWLGNLPKLRNFLWTVSYGNHSMFFIRSFSCLPSNKSCCSLGFLISCYKSQNVCECVRKRAEMKKKRIY